ncbi:MAG: hypothetical protein WDN45_05795 [Caulobacteraceae bacterium]
MAVAAEQVVSIPGGRAALYGTLERPDMTAAPGPAVLLWAGSGQRIGTEIRPPGALRTN